MRRASDQGSSRDQKTTARFTTDDYRIVMNEEPISSTAPTPEELRAACQTLLGMPGPNPELAAKLRYVADLLADAGPLPPFPLLVWREADQKVRHAVIQRVFVVGRAPGPAGLA